MITIADTLDAAKVALDLPPGDSKAAIRHVAELLRGDVRVLEWDTLVRGLLKTAPCLCETESEFGICLPHIRTEAVMSMVMSVGRSLEGITFPKCEKPIRYVFCIGVPKAMASDYLRIVGVLTRILKDRTAEAGLSEAHATADFVARLTQLEVKL